MFEFDVITKDTPIIRAKRKTEGIAEYPKMPQIYHKIFDINEFIGEELAGIRGVNSVHYFPILFDDIENILKINNGIVKSELVRVGSFDFKKPDIKYFIGSELPNYNNFYTFDELLNLCPNDKNRQEVINELLEVYGLDIYTGQTDRPSNIFYEFHPNGEIHISKLFDYEWSFDEELNESYITDFHIFRTICSYQRLIKDYPQFETILRNYLDVDLEKIINKMAKSRKFDLKYFEMDAYKRFDEVSHKRLEKILR